MNILLGLYLPVHCSLKKILRPSLLILLARIPVGVILCYWAKSCQHELPSCIPAWPTWILIIYFISYLKQYKSRLAYIDVMLRIIRCYVSSICVLNKHVKWSCLLLSLQPLCTSDYEENMSEFVAYCYLVLLRLGRVLRPPMWDQQCEKKTYEDNGNKVSHDRKQLSIYECYQTYKESHLMMEEILWRWIYHCHYQNHLLKNINQCLFLINSLILY